MLLLVGWDLLPHELLVSIFQYLEMSDLLRASRVCEQWCRVYHLPCLWRERVIRLSNDRTELAETLKVLKQTIKIMGIHARHLSVSCQYLTAGESCHVEKLRCRILTMLLCGLSLNGTSPLKSFVVSKLLGDHNTLSGRDETSRNLVIEELAEFLEDQTELDHLDLHRSFLTRMHSETVMQSLAKSKSAESLTWLAIVRFYRKDVHTATIRNQLTNVLANCQKLTQINLNYRYLRAVGVENVCEMLKETLLWLVVEAHFPEDELDYKQKKIISSQNWQLACQRCARLQVEVILPRRRTDWRLYLVPGMPLAEVVADLDYQPSYSEELGDTASMLLYHLTKYFKETLTLVTIKTRSTNPVSTPTKECLVYCLDKCLQIEQLTFSPELMTQDLIRQVRLQVHDGFDLAPDVIAIR